MTTFYLDPDGGNDANNGQSFANRWKTFASGATAARIAPGDTIRVIASPYETLVGNATWTNNSRTVTLASAVTQTLADGESAWTASANVTCTTSAACKQGSTAASIAIAAGFTTGKVAYKAIGSTLDLSGYQQLSAMLLTNAAIANATTLKLCLCSDTTGDTIVDTFYIPAKPDTTQWLPFTVDKGSALGSSVQSIALYADSDPGAITLTLDSVIACKAASAADSLSLTSLIGKAHNRSWEASTAYSLNDKRRPTQPNRNGFQYKVTTAGTTGASEPTWPVEYGATVTDGGVVWTCEELEDTYYPIAGISGTTLLLDGASNTLANTAAPQSCYQGATETVATYKREPMKRAAMLANTFSSQTTDVLQDSGTEGNPITISGGWNRTDMSTQDGETWITGQNWTSQGLILSNRNYWKLVNFNTTRFVNGVVEAGSNNGYYLEMFNCHAVGHHDEGIVLTGSSGRLYARGIVCNNNSTVGFSIGALLADCHCIVTNGNAQSSPQYGITFGSIPSRFNYVVAKGNSVGIGNYTTTTGSDCVISNLTTANNSSAGASSSVSRHGGMVIVNSNMGEASPVQALGSYAMRGNRLHKFGGDVTDNRILYDQGTIRSVTDVRHTASGLAWKFNPTATRANSGYPLRLSVLKLQCAADAAKSVQIWCRRDNSNIKGRLIVCAGSAPGIPEDVSVSLDPASLNTWEQSSALTFTPTEACVIEVWVEVWDGVGTANSFWIDDLTVS